MPRPKLLKNRQKTHGDFADNARISQKLKDLFEDERLRHNPVSMSDVKCEALDMIALKLSRILSGQDDFKDHWDDIAGYAQLAAEECE